MLTVLIPLAGEGKRFREAGYQLPKPLIDVNGKTMIQRVVENLDSGIPCRWVFVILNEHNVHHGLAKHLWSVCPNGFVVPILEPTEGAVCTCLAAKHRIPEDEELLIANCDQLITGISSDHHFGDSNAAVFTMEKHDDPRWSYVRSDSEKGGEMRRVYQVVEKKPISDRATCGLYWFRRAGDFFDAARRMIHAQDRVNKEFYVAPTLNYLIIDGKYVREVPIESFGGSFTGLGTPEDLQAYLGEQK